MTREQLRLRLIQDYGWRFRLDQMSRLTSSALNEPPSDRPPGAPGHRDYSELDYRRVVSYLRVQQLLGPPENTHSQSLASQIVELLATRTQGYVYVSDGHVWWSTRPPLANLRGGVATCWPVWE